MTKEALKLAAQAVLNQWNSPAWTWHKLGPTGDLMADLQEALAQPLQEPRPWAGLTGQEKAWIASVSLDVHDAVHRTDAKLKEKNNGISSRSMANGSPFQ